MATDALNAQYCATIISNYMRIMVMCQLQVTNPTTGNLDALIALDNSTAASIAAVTGVNVVRPKISYTEEGANYLWKEYQEMIPDQIEAWRKLQVVFQEPFEVRSWAV